MIPDRKKTEVWGMGSLQGILQREEMQGKHSVKRNSGRNLKHSWKYMACWPAKSNHLPAASGWKL